MDYKEWIQTKAEELALEKYDEDFYSLLNCQQLLLFNKAEDLYKDYYSALIDAKYEAEIERRLMEGSK